MRPFIPVMALALAAMPALAQPSPQDTPAAPISPPAATQDATPPSASPARPVPRAQRVPRSRITADQRFDAANTTHDGRLTRGQADAARMRMIVKNFASIDRDNKGYVTKQDLAAFHRAHPGKRARPNAPLPTVPPPNAQNPQNL